MAGTLWLDIETFSPVNLKTAGVHVYRQNVELLLNAWALDDGPVQIDETLTAAFLDAFRSANRIIAHNAEFDRTCLSNWIPDIRFDRWDCTMARARRHGLPGGLGALCDILGVPQDKAKDKTAHDDLLLFCKPTADGKRNTKATHPDRWARFVAYAGQDVVAMREVAARLPIWNDAHERRVWLADQRINARGFAVDLDFVEKAIALLKSENARLDAAAADQSDGALESARQRDAFLKLLLEQHGVKLPDLTAATLERRLKDEDLPAAVRDLIELRLESSRTSTAKYAVFGRVACADGRVRGALTYCAAKRTKRWGGNRVQPQNFKRPAVGNLRGEALRQEIRASIKAVKAGIFSQWSPYPATEVLSSALRGAIVPAPGKLLVVADWSNVEGRKTAWLAGEETKLQAFRDFDAGTGPDLYRKEYADAFGVAIEDVDDFQRQIGKVMELMLGFGGGVGAFVTGAHAYKIELVDLVRTAWPAMPEDVKAETADAWAWAVGKKRTYGLPEAVYRTCDGLKRLWRRRHPCTERLWSDPEWRGGSEGGLEDVVRRVLRTGRGEDAAGGRLGVERWRNWLKVHLPSGSILSYPGAQTTSSDKIRFLGENPYTKQWGWVYTYGGKLVENVVQGSCRDLLADVLVDCEQAGLSPVLHVHDEPVLEIAESEAERVLGMLVERMKHCEWAPGLPLAVKGYTTDVYEKE